jgi:co-chaperonin GroES (HSP10)
MPHELIKLTPKEFERFKPINNNVIIECIIPEEEVRPSGLIIVKDLEFFISTSKESVEALDQSAHLDRYGIVRKIPDKLDCKKMDWETEIEIQVGDMVWFDYHSAHHCPIIQVEDKKYRVLEYYNLIVAKRNWLWTLNIKIQKKVSFNPEIIPLNGYCLFEEISELPKTKLIIPFQHIDKKIGIVKFIGNKNKSYKNKKKFDDMDFKVEDKVIFRNEVNNLLENSMHRIFSDGDLRYNQRTDVLGILN